MNEFDDELSPIAKQPTKVVNKTDQRETHVTTIPHKITKANDLQEGGNHYKSLGVEPWDVIDTWPIEQQIGFHRGNILKYTIRLGAKDANLQEAKKIAHYVQKLVEVLERDCGCRELLRGVLR